MCHWMKKNAAWLLAAPGTPTLVAISNDMRRQARPQLVGLHFPVHRAFAHHRIRRWQPYENAERGIIPSDAAMASATIGIPPYYVPDLRVVDELGLTDVTIARNPVTRSNNERGIAHDRSPPPGCLQQRGVNFRIHPAAASEAVALSHANYALNVGPGLWMPFDVADHQWANERFASRDLRAVNRFSQTDPTGNRLEIDGVRYVGEQFLGRFETGLDGWRLEGKAVSNHKHLPYYKPGRPILGHVGPGFLTTYWPGKWERTGKALAPTFTARSDQYLTFLVAGELNDYVGMRLLADGEEVAVWSGDDTDAFDLVLYPLKYVAGKKLQLEIFNEEIGDKPRLMVDHIMLVRKEAAVNQ